MLLRTEIYYSVHIELHVYAIHKYPYFKQRICEKIEITNTHFLIVMKIFLKRSLNDIKRDIILIRYKIHLENGKANCESEAIENI